MRHSTPVRRWNVLLIPSAALAVALLLVLAACGGEEEAAPEATVVPAATAASVSPTATTAAPAAMPSPTAAPGPTAAATSAPAPASAPATAQPAPTQPPAPAPTEAPEPTPEPPNPLAVYAAEHANGPGAIFVGDPTQLIGPPPHEGLMFQFPAELYTQVAGLGLMGSPQLRVPSHMFIYTSDYYQRLIQKARLTNPTELVSSGEDIEIQHVCLARTLPTCVLIQAYWAPNLAKRTNGQVKLSVISLAELGLSGPDTLDQVGDGTLEMVNIFTGYVAGAVPALEVQSLWGTAPDWETSYLMLTALSDDVDRKLQRPIMVINT